MKAQLEHAFLLASWTSRMPLR